MVNIGWKGLLMEELKLKGEKWEDIQQIYYESEEEFQKLFNAGYGVEEGCHFTAWSKNWVYFPACYDGSEWVESVPRNPTPIATKHIGG